MWMFSPAPSASSLRKRLTTSPPSPPTRWPEKSTLEATSGPLAHLEHRSRERLVGRKPRKAASGGAACVEQRRKPLAECATRHSDGLGHSVGRDLERQLHPRCPGELADQVVEHREPARDVDGALAELDAHAHLHPFGLRGAHGVRVAQEPGGSYEPSRSIEAPRPRSRSSMRS